MSSGFDRSRDRWFREAQPDNWHVPPSGFPRLRTLLVRALTRRCPYCGTPRIFKNWFSLKDTCPNCAIPFEREEGYFVGTYAVNIVGAEVIAFAIVITLIIGTDLSVLRLQMLAVTLGVGLPILGYPFATSVWMTLDLMFDPPEKAVREQA